MMYVEPELAKCPTGAGGVSVFTCGAACTVRVLDFSTGTVCQIADSPQFDVNYDDMNMFSATGALQRPLIVVVTEQTIINGIDAISGELLYTYDVNPSELEYPNVRLLGASPDNSRLAYWFNYGDQFTNRDVLVFQHIANGSVYLQEMMNVSTYYEASTAAWINVAENTFGSIAMAGNPNREQDTGILIFDSMDGSMSARDVPTRRLKTLANIGNVWTFGFSETNFCEIAGFPVYSTPTKATNFTHTYSTTTCNVASSWFLEYFNYADGAPGMATVGWGFPNRFYGVGFLTAFRF